MRIATRDADILHRTSLSIYLSFTLGNLKKGTSLYFPSEKTYAKTLLAEH